jgi:hypothetical protein
MENVFSGGGVPALSYASASDGEHEKPHPSKNSNVSEVEHPGAEGTQAEGDEVGDSSVVQKPIEPVRQATTRDKAKANENRNGSRVAVQNVDAQAEDEQRHDADEENVSNGLWKTSSKTEKGSGIRDQLEPEGVARERNAPRVAKSGDGDSLRRVIAARGTEKDAEKDQQSSVLRSHPASLRRPLARQNTYALKSRSIPACDERLPRRSSHVAL